MIFKIIALIINLVVILGFFAFMIFPLYGLLGPRLGAGPRAIRRWRSARRAHKWEHEVGIKHTKDYDFDFWMCDRS